MSLIVEVKTKSLNGLPYKTLRRAMREHNMELVESIAYSYLARHKVVYDVTMHESVNPDLELKGR